MQRVLSLLLILFSAMHARADVNDQDVDDVLTNPRLRAESGSKSRWSVAAQLNYAGGSINQPFGQRRPNVTANTGTTRFTDIDGTINAKYNIDSRDSLLMGSGVRWITPFNGWRAPRGDSIKKFDAFDPSFNYQHVYKVLGAQSYFQVGPTYITRSDMVAEGYLVNLGIYNVNAWELDSSGVTLGFESSLTYGFFKNPTEPTDDLTVEEVEQDQSDYNVIVNPYVEYKFNDVFNLRVSCNIISYEHTRAPSEFWTWYHDRVTVAAGLGISVTRDLFLYPNIIFVPDSVRAADTNVGLLADINIF